MIDARNPAALVQHKYPHWCQLPMPFQRLKIGKKKNQNCFYVFSCDQAALRPAISVCLSVCLSVRLSVCPSVTPFYPRPVLAFGYCRCLRVCVCMCVRVSVNHELVRAIIHQPLKLGSPSLDQRCKRPWLRSLLFCGVIDGDLQGQIELESQNLPHFGLVSLSRR